MSATTPEENAPVSDPDTRNAPTGLGVTPSNANRNVTQRSSRPSNRTGPVQSSTTSDFEGATTKLNAILALRSENVNKKVNYDRFLEKLAIYVINELKNGDSIIEITRNPNAKIIEDFQKENKPEELSDEDKKSTVDIEIHKEEIKEYVKDLKQIKTNLKKIYGIVFGNCTESVQTMTRTDSEYEQKSKIFDHAWLLQKVKTIVSGLDTKVNLRVSLHDVIINFMLLKQFGNETNEAYHSRFKSMVETLKIAGGEHILISPEMLGIKLDAATGLQLREEKEKFMAVCFVLRSDPERYKVLLNDLKRSANLGRDEYPKTLTEAFDLLVRESGEYDTVRPPSNRYRGRGGRGGRGRYNFLFAQQGRGGRSGRGEHESENTTYSRMNTDETDEVVAGTDGDSFPNIGCYGCNFHGHYRTACPYATRTGVMSMHVGYMLTQDDCFEIPKSWVLLDTCSTCDVSNNPHLVKNIRACDPNEILLAYTNGGSQKFDKLADLRFLPITVHFKEKSMATILSLKTVSEIEGARLTLDTKVNKNITLTLKEGDSFVFSQYKNGLYFFDTNTIVTNLKPKPELKNYSFLKTVLANKQFFPPRKLKERIRLGKFKSIYFPPDQAVLRTT